MDRPLCLEGKTYKTGLGTHPDSEISVRLPIGVRRLTGLCGVNDSPDTRLRSKDLVFSVEAGGKEVWRSGPQTVTDKPARVDVRLGGCREFTLRVKGVVDWGHANWVDLKVTLTDGTSMVIGKPPDSTVHGFSFTYGGKSSVALLAKWKLKKQRLPDKDGVILHLSLIHI